MTASSWALSYELSPRDRVRVAIVDAYGETLNEYRDRRMATTVPARPWAVYLAGSDHRFRLLAFDLDAKGDPARAARDADVLAGLLTDTGIENVVCASGPTGGRHVWAALSESVDAATVDTLARLVQHLCPSLDLSPLTNPATGCVRPPGAPHRAGGHSTVLRGDVAALTAPTTTAAAVRDLVTRVAGLVDDTEPSAAVDPHTPLPVDAHGRLYLVGPRRPLPAVSAAALTTPAADENASAVLWRVLIGAAAARWRHADVAALVPTSAGLEHVRTRATPSGRRTRHHGEHAAVLARQWDKAVRYVASTDRQIGDDPTFERRAHEMAAHVRHVQARADAAAGRWTTGGGPADRRVLDVLCSLALQALSASLEADGRRLALLAGIGRETARTALLRLAEDGWIARTAEADGPHGAHWTIDPRQLLHTPTDHARSQADPRPLAGSAERTALLATLRTRTETTAHDLFTATRPALGHLAGNLYARTDTTPRTTDELAAATGLDLTRTRRLLVRLAWAGLLVQLGPSWQRVDAPQALDAAAERAGVAGRLDARAERYRVERELWAWWKAEEAWMHAPRRPGSNRRPSRGQLSLVPDDGTHAYGPLPRQIDGRLDWAAARRIVLDERGGTALRPQEERRRQLPQNSSPVVEQPTAAELIVTRLLGAVRIA